MLNGITMLAVSRVGTIQCQKTVELDQCSAIQRDTEKPYRTVLKLDDLSKKYDPL